MVETGVVGDYFTEGESDEVAISRSGSHLIEGFHSTTKTRKFGVGAMAGGLIGGVLVGGSVSHSRSTTSISGGREVSEQLDTTNRQASEERRELLSHTTNVSNVLTLLNGSLVGTNMLHFSLWPQPLRPLQHRSGRRKPVVRGVVEAAIQRHRRHAGVLCGRRRATGRGLLCE